MSFRCCTFSGRFIFMLNVVTILVLTLFYVALENKISILISKHEINSTPLTESKGEPFVGIHGYILIGFLRSKDRTSPR